MPTYEPVTAIVRALKVLEAVAAAGSVTLKALHAATGLPKSTLVRMLETLKHAGYVDGAGQPPAYSLTARTLSLAGGFNRGHYLAARLGPILDEFRSSTRWPCDIGIFDRDAIVILESSRQPGALSVNWQVGSRLSATRTALGRAYLAHLPDAERKARLAAICKTTDEIKDQRRFEERLFETRAHGYALNDQEDRPGIRSIAAPVFEGSMVVASVTISVVAEAMSLADLEARHAGDLIAAARKMSGALG